MTSLSRFTAALLGVTTLQSGALGQSNPQPEIIVKEVILPLANADWETHWKSVQSVLDPSTLTTSGLIGQRILNSHQGFVSSPLWGLHDRSRSLLSSDHEPEFVGLGFFPKLALVATPSGTELWAATRSASPNLATYDIDTSRQLRVIDIPDLPGHQESSIWHLQYAGDLNGDGWGEVFMGCQSLGEDNSFYLCADGKTGAAHWIYETGRMDADPLPTTQLHPGLPPDLDGDGVPDFLVRDYFVYMGATLRSEVMALSGATGSLIWDKAVDWVPYLPEVTLTEDLNSDGVNDVLVYGGTSTTSLPHTEAWSGKDGSLLWKSDLADIEAALAPDTVVLGGLRTFVNPAPDGSGPQIAMGIKTISAVTGGDAAQIAFIDATTGKYLSHSAPPTSLSPFHHELFPQDWVPTNFPAGDYDGDGLHETVEIRTLDSEDTMASPDRPGALVIFGQRTLYGSDTVTSGSAMDLQIRIPTMPLQSFQLLASSKLSQRLSPSLYVHGGMPTLLGHSLLLSRTASHPTLSGTLDILGAADLTVQIPSASALIGSTIYSRAAILDPVYPGEVMTQSTILATQVR